ncbi:twin-arginine translocase TatA/TatE family subunit [Streptomyces sp. NPDC007904]|jgi:sec-independent protein translocase protein TatA|uniref:twin-arginine translocase TatA/TatE family subunit n=1 Tax=Streptomyces sp. NPDC007904 TaxID=3364787 RepID=UPI0036EFAF06
MFGLSEFAVILIVVIAVLAAKKLPDLARSAGKSARILKAEARAAKEEDQPEAPRVIQGEAVRQDAPASASPSAPSAPSAQDDADRRRS